MKTGIFWFANDLRLHDNPALMRASTSLDELLCIYVIDYRWRSSSFYPQANIKKSPDYFLRESLAELNVELNNIGQKLLVFKGDTISIINDLIDQSNVSDIFRSNNAGWYENKAWGELSDANAETSFHTIDSHTLFNLESLPFALECLPSTFTKFKKAVSDTEVIKPLPKIADLPSPPSIDHSTLNRSGANPDTVRFRGGERYALAHLNDYFTTEKPMFYKEVRNAIDGWDNSCKLSPWLANGCLSARTVISVLAEYEKDIKANESTYWIYFELLWREYFQWYAHKNDTKLFSFDGIKGLAPLTSFYPERFQKWINGTTPYAIVNACMNELRETGYLSNRGRQIVASCLVNELAMDWRYGAAYFEYALIDYDVASNWGNWQYLAGVGADARDKRHFNLEKQTQIFDPDGRYINEWKGGQNLQPLDSMDAADWPIS